MVLSGADKKFGIRTNLFDRFQSVGILPKNPTTDLLKLGLTVFTADKSAHRDQAYNKWSRSFYLYQPVANLDLWNGVKAKLEETLDFLTGDHWEIAFRKANNEESINNRQIRFQLQDQSPEFANVALFSGGLDSFTGAIDLLESTQGRTIFVSHYGQGGIAKAAQDRLYTLLNRFYPDRFCPIQFYVQPPGESGEAEPSQRSRSFLYLTLGVAVASALETSTPLNIFENGFLSLNVPLSSNRGGGLSTRTTHPYYLTNFQRILDSLDINVSIKTPFRFYTKGEILKDTKNPIILKEGIRLAHSCSHSTYVRFKGATLDYHCGFCFPCIVRRAATYYSGMNDVNYVVDVLSDDLPPYREEGKDIYAVKIALKRLETQSTSLLSHVRASAPLPGTKEEIEQYVDVYRRGIDELAYFLSQK